ncbi:MAG TPA: hypothetical protein VND65_19645 [Candidatus Binatia bacterium]|nr:hypothetical protein [Candidatus Binatia bacterium]
MPSIHAAIEYLKALETKGRGQETVHVVMVEQEQRERIKNPGPRKKTKFVLQTDDPMTFSQFHAERERIFKRCGMQKSIALFIMLEGWRRMTDVIIDKFIALEEGAPDR